MKDKRYDFQYRGYKYAPETMELFNHGKKVNINAGNSMLKEWLACHNLDKVIPEAKRIVRKQQKRDNIVYTIGFKMDNGSIAFSRALFTNDRFDLNELMSIYNCLKEQFNKDNWEYKTKIEVGDIIPGQKTKPKIKYSIEKITKQPIIVKLRYSY
jgi:hypothetical protein